MNYRRRNASPFSEPNVRHRSIFNSWTRIVGRYPSNSAPKQHTPMAGPHREIRFHHRCRITNLNLFSVFAVSWCHFRSSSSSCVVLGFNHCSRLGEKLLIAAPPQRRERSITQCSKTKRSTLT
ncbi:hypothetical protein PIB30_032695 [Stylosanthes scabra]|uniref:Uncharacterized protein n=1 Tax=Stylosanthes scabra TaxID=79078 RepID=A0ABU6QBQ9_9FABA|nr:hypothetical protein [Stylosanthes scabra]